MVRAEVRDDGMTRVVDTYELSPMQSGMLFHAVRGGDAGVDIEQVVATLHEQLDDAQFVRAWQRVADRHPVLRSRFRWEGVAEPVQEVVDRVQIPVTRFDWRTLAEAERRQRFQALVDHERISGFELHEAPLMRLALVRAGEGETWMLWTIHHILIDGRSRSLLLQEVFAFYEAFLRGGEIDFPLPRPYRDYIAWLRKLDCDGAKAYWQGALAGFPAPTPLVVSRDRETAQLAGSVSGSHEIRLSAGITSALRKLAREAPVTLSLLLQGAWALLLHRYSGELDIVFGTTRAGRRSTVPGADKMIGLFINTLPVRVRVDPEAELVPWLQQLGAQHAAQRDYEHTPLVKVQGWSDAPRGTPLFDSILVFDNATLDNQLRAQGGAWNDRRFQIYGQTNYPLTVAVYGDQELLLQIEYSRRCFDDDVVARMLGHLQTLLEGMAAHPQARLKDLPLLTESERHESVEVWNQTSVDFPAARCVHELVEEQARVCPEALAAESGGRSVTYQELDERAERVAEQLQSQGVGPNALVAVFLERSLDMLVGLLGVWKAGGAYVPIDPEYPAERVRFMLEDTKAVVVLTQKSLAAALPATNAVTFLLDVEEGRVAESSRRRANRSPMSPDQLAYVIYTSGSTGRPKGVPIKHASLFNLICWHQRTYDVRPADRATQIAGPAFDASVWEIWPYLSAGASVHIPDGATRLDAGLLVRWLAERQITLAFLPTPLAEAALRERWPETTALRVLLTGGDKLNQRPAQQLPFRLVNHYGPTENTVVSTFSEVEATGTSSAAPPIGRPLPNTQAYVLDRYLQPVPIGVPGELFVGGVQLASGYWNRPELSAERFIPHPFSTTPGARLYKTGDLVRYLPDGNIGFLGRIDDQVKIRGYRIELGEIEVRIAQHAAIREVVVLAREDVAGDKRLVAYLVSENAPADLLEQLRSQLRASLPAYMVPAHFVKLDALPLTSNGKVDRKTLPAPDRPPVQQADYVAPRTATQEILAGIWAEVLGAERVGVEDNFFELGGHSLLATQVVSRVRAALGVELALRHVFVAPTIAGLAVCVEALRVDSSPGLTAPPLVAVLQPDPAELSFSQQRLWFLDQIAPAGTAYIIARALALRGALDVAVLARALKALIARHESLRTVFVKIEGKPLQVVSDPGPWTLPVVDLSGEAHAREHLAQLLREEASRGFDLARGPLFRGELYRLTADAHVLLLSMHHIISDGWSLGVLMRELGELYGGFLRGAPTTLPALRLQYRDFARWQRGWLRGNVLESQLAHWRLRLAGAPQVLELPTDRPRPPVESHRGALYSFMLPLELVDRLRGLARREGATLFMTLFSGFALLLARYSGQQDLLVGTPVANRSHAEIEALVGFFVNTLVLRADVSGEFSVREFLGRIREVCLDAYAHQDLPFDRLVEELHPARDMSRNPLVQVMFALQNAPQDALELPGLLLKPVEVGRGAAQVDLTLTVQETPDGLSGNFEYATDLFDESTIAHMSAHWRSLLEAIIASPGRRVCELPLLTESERHQLLNEWNDTEADPPADALANNLFEAQAHRTPGHTAVRFGATELSYGELDARSNRIAQTLRSRGVSRGQRVGLHVERGIDMLAAMLGILKAGAAYVPLDPSFPAERLRFMAEDAQLALLVSSTSLASAFGLSRERQLLLDADAQIIASSPDTRLPVDARSARPEDPAYVIYTSGSTGKPKGVVVPHRAVVNFLTSMAREPGMAAGDVLVAVTTLSFDIAVLELQLPLTVGATVVIASRDETIDGRALGALLERHGATVMQATPSTWRLLLEAGWAGRSPFKALVGGEAMPRDLAEQLIARGVELWNMYGPTETTVWSTCARITDTANGIPIGKPIANTTVRILDAHNALCPIGIPGELCIGGEGVALGYWNRPELSAERFIPDPFNPGGRLYRTGDRARWRLDGTLEHLGRFDFQVKLRGYRIELGEIEAGIAQHPAIREVIVVAREVVPGDKRLVAYLVSANAPADLHEQLRKLLRASLPAYMVPAHFVDLEALPLTDNGKVDRKALPDPHTAERGLGTDTYVAPRTDLEISLATVWERVLAVPRVGITDNFFELGGNSLSVIKLIFEMEQATGVDIALGEVFRSPTIAELITRLGPAATRNASVVVPLQPEGDGVPIFCLCGINLYREFAQSLGKGQPVFGVYVEEEQAIVNKIIRGDTPVVSIELLVEAYYKAVARFRPRGPYRLAGLSFGGMLAMDLATRLRECGDQVDLVMLLDTMLPQGIHRNWSKWFYRQLAEIMTGNGKANLRRLYARFRDRIVKRLPGPGVQTLAKYVDEAFADRQVAAFSQASKHWKAHESISGLRVVLFRGSDRSSWGEQTEFDEDYGWRSYLGEQLSVVNVTGDHLGILRSPHVAELGRRAQQYLRPASAR